MSLSFHLNPAKRERNIKTILNSMAVCRAIPFKVAGKEGSKLLRLPLQVSMVNWPLPPSRYPKVQLKEAGCPSGLGRWGLEVPGSNPPPYRFWDLFSVSPSSTPRPRRVNTQLVSPSPVGIVISSRSICNIVCLFTVSSISTTD